MEIGRGLNCHLKIVVMLNALVGLSPVTMDVLCSVLVQNCQS